MKISYNWLRTLIDLKESPKEIAEILTQTGLEVSHIEVFESIKGGLEGLVIGQVSKVEKHPNADKLRLTQVLINDSEHLPIVCGAPNVAIGQKVVVATPGTVLYGKNNESFTIKKSKIRGEESHGMLCAEDEIGLGKSHDGIMILDQKAKVGTPAKEYFSIETDSIIEIDLTPNRIDGASHFGVARDLKAYYAPKKEMSLKKPSSTLSIAKGKCPVEVKVNNPNLCQRYAGIVIENIAVNDSPEWLKNRLQSIDIQPINNIVDVTNFVLHELGHPLHAFDLAKIKGNTIQVKTVQKNTPFVALDGKERKLLDTDLMICNNQEPMCMAGIFGGEKSGVSPATKAIFIESAHFNPVSIRKSSKAHNLNTDASFRFERGADPEMVIPALERAVNMILTILPQAKVSAYSDYYPKPIKNEEITLSKSYLSKIIGFEIPDDTTTKILKALDFDVLDYSANTWRLKAPLYRVDVTRPIDVIEEILRIYGYNTHPLNPKIKVNIIDQQENSQENLRSKISTQLRGFGFTEIMNNSLMAEEDLNSTGNSNNAVKLINPLSNELNVLRTSLMPGMLKTALHNINRQNANFKLFELGRTYTLKEKAYHEEEKIGLLISGNKWPQNWKVSEEVLDLFDLKGVMEALFKTNLNPSVALNQTCIGTQEIEYTWKNTTIAKVISLSEGVKKHFEIGSEIQLYYAEIDFKALLNLCRKKPIPYQKIAKFPMVKRDLSLLIEQKAQYLDLLTWIKELKISTLVDVNLFDNYQGKGIPSGKKAYGIQLTFQDNEKTLTDKLIDKNMEKILSGLKSKIDFEMR